ncbi:o-succinylbenzoate--CoA ligase [Lysinibacillus cavernae]|uniref:o-succinylbenzoate--CoA ligase n=1 Tax=Lysinibacillus cavernae TaxID=2666135 RepID=UPI0012D89686|nr:o-succinylbenzoate--CoA ligase [Lysinibacillus cavernae]
MNINIGKLLQHRAVLMGEKEAFIHKDKRWTFQQMNARANGFAHFLKKQGFAKGDRLAILCKNNEDFIAVLMGASKIGVVTVVLNWRLQVPELQYIVGHSKVKLVIYDVDFESTIQALQEQGVITDVLSHTTVPSLQEVFDENVQEPVYDASSDDVALIMYTSGTTGKPKGAMISHNNLYAAGIGLSQTIDWWEDDRFLMVAPFFHIGGIAPLITNIMCGCTMVLMETFEPMAAWKIVEQEKITTMMTVPTMLAYLLKTYEVAHANASSIRNITCGASSVPVPLILGFRQLGIPIQQVYGITEYTGAVTMWKEQMDKDKYDSMGKSMMHGEIAIVDVKSDEVLSPGEVGEISLRGPQVFVGYFENMEATKQVLRNGWYLTGDVGYMDRDGYLFVVDRIKDMIISGGENIYSAELELVLATHPAVTDVAVIGVPDEKWGEIPKAYIVVKPEVSITEAEIMAFCKENLASYKAVKEVEFVEQLPRNAVGKLLKHQLKQGVKQ